MVDSFPILSDWDQSFVSYALDDVTGRQTIVSNASTIVQILTIALGTFFLITAIILIVAYASSVGGSNNPIGRSLRGTYGGYSGELRSFQE